MSGFAQQGSMSTASLSSLPSTLGEISHLVEVCSNKMRDLYHQMKTREAALQDRVDQCVHRLSVLEGQMLDMSSQFERQFNEPRGKSEVDKDVMLGADGSAYHSASSVNTLIQEAIDSQISHRVKYLVEKTLSEDHMQDLVNRIKVLEAQANPTQAVGIPASSETVSDVRYTHKLTAADVKREAMEENTHTIQDNVWEASILVGVEFLRIRDSVALILSLLVNIMLQSIVLGIVGISFMDSTLPDVEDVRRWREEHAHQVDNMIDSTRTALARAVCEEDPALIISTQQERLHGTIERYTRFTIPVGAVLCAMVLLFWFMSVAKEYRNAIGFLQGISILPRNKNGTELLVTSEGIEIRSLSDARRLFIYMVSCVRISIALLLFVLGAIWQAQTIDVQELLLNAAALAMVMDIDEMLFDAMTSPFVYVLIEKLKPLTKPLPQCRPSKAYALQLVGMSTNITLVLAVCVIWSVYVIPNLQNMDDIMHAMCGGNKDFVIYSNDLDIVSVNDLSLSRSVNSSTRASHQWSAVREVIGLNSYADEYSTLVKSRDVPSFSSFMDFRKNSLELQVLSFTSHQMGSVCRDYDVTKRFAIPALRSALAIKHTPSNCTGLIHKCASKIRLVRMLCPETCGCDDPRSGLYENGGGEGCPKEVCIKTKRYRDRLASIPCRDYNMSELSEMAAWPRLLRRMRDIAKEDDPGRAKQIDAVIDRLVAAGCASMTGASYFRRRFCEPTPSYGSLRPFCPVACNCLDPSIVNPSECPPQCFS